MRLLHYKLIYYLPSNMLTEQYEACCKLRMLWNEHLTCNDNYALNYPLVFLYSHHCQIIHEMILRGDHVDTSWLNSQYCGKQRGYDNDLPICDCSSVNFPEHDDKYLKECLEYLKSNNVKLVNGETISHMLLSLVVKKGF